MTFTGYHLYATQQQYHDFLLLLFVSNKYPLSQTAVNKFGKNVGILPNRVNLYLLCDEDNAIKIIQFMPF